MNVAFFIAETSPGGAENQLIDMMNSLDDENNYIFIYLRRGGLHHRLVSGKYRCVQISYPDIKIFRYFIISWKLSNIIKNEKIDIVYSFLFESNFIAYLAKFIRRFHFIASLRVSIDTNLLSVSCRYKLIVALLYRVYKKADIVISNSESACEYFKTIYRFDNFKVIKNFITTENQLKLSKFSINQHNNNRIVLGTLSRLDQQKNPYLMIDAVEMLCLHHNVQMIEVVWVGKESGIKSKDVLKYAKSKGVNFKYIEPTNDRFLYLSKFDVSFLFSNTEGVSNFLIESMIAGKKIVATDVGDSKSILDKRTSVTCSNNTESFSKALFKIITANISDDILQEVSRDKAKEFDIIRNIQEHKDVFVMVINQ